MTLEGAQVAGGDAVGDEVTGGVGDVGDAAGFGGVVATWVGGERGGGVGEGAAGGIDSAADDETLKLLDVASGVLSA